ncbi:fatty acid desaturase family protein [Larkinella soli]|uniref:fatty acid desaturase family protein n=1 Tax=Larkinella soli TaxID=1770527 RepID=UPI000FFB50A8|nr:fatty acid desaturase [Larkinella soli]
MKVLEAIGDPTFIPRPYSPFDRFLLQFIRDERDLPFLHLQLLITLTVIPLGILLYLPFVTGWAWWLITITYLFISVLRLKGPFGLMLHCVTHRPLFRKEYDGLNYYLPWVIGPFFGQTPETYFSHHIGMHHAENNLHDDDSSTMPYQRDSLRGFGRYVMNFILFGLANLMNYHRRKNRVKYATRAFWGEMSFFALCIGLCFVSVSATVVVFILPFFISRVIAMLGNWTQHSFVDPEDPGNPYKNSITCINVKYNHKCWNDGYHISHHARPAMHWTEHPDFFRKTLHKYAENRAIIFDGLDYLRIFLLLMNKRYDTLARHVVNIDGTFGSEEEVIALLKKRTTPIVYPEPH